MVSEDGAASPVVFSIPYISRTQVSDLEFHVHVQQYSLHCGFFREFLGLGKQQTQDGSCEDGVRCHYVAKGGNGV
jgi:hypothetical protein